MRRILTAVVACATVMAFAPSLAQARHHHRRHHRSHAVHAVRHRRGVRHRRFGSSGSTTTGQQQSAGTVTSFDSGVLTITLNDGSTVSGQVTNDTNLECMAASSNTQSEDGDGGPNGSDDSSGDGDNSSQSGDGENSSVNDGDDNGGDDDQGDQAQSCMTSSLTPGTPVAEANLQISNAGAVWQKVELITS